MPIQHQQRYRHLIHRNTLLLPNSPQRVFCKLTPWNGFYIHFSFYFSTGIHTYLSTPLAKTELVDNTNKNTTIVNEANTFLIALPSLDINNRYSFYTTVFLRYCRSIDSLISFNPFRICPSLLDFIKTYWLLTYL